MRQHYSHSNQLCIYTPPCCELEVFLLVCLAIPCIRRGRLPIHYLTREPHIPDAGSSKLSSSNSRAGSACCSPADRLIAACALSSARTLRSHCLSMRKCLRFSAAKRLRRALREAATLCRGIGTARVAAAKSPHKIYAIDHSIMVLDYARAGTLGQWYHHRGVETSRRDISATTDPASRGLLLHRDLLPR